MVLHAKGHAYEPLPVPCGSTKSPEYLRQNPLGKIPALVVKGAAESVSLTFTTQLRALCSCGGSPAVNN